MIRLKNTVFLQGRCFEKLYFTFREGAGVIPIKL